MTNLEVANLLKRVAAALTVRGEMFFKIQAYEKAADSIEHSTSEIKDLWEAGKLDTIPGLGKHMQSYLDELFRRGQVNHFEKLLKNLPPGMFEILDIPGIGPKTAHKIAKELDVKSLRDLKKAAVSGKLAKIPGLGSKTAQEILSGIEDVGKREKRMLLPYAWNLADNLVSQLKKAPGIIEAVPLGSLRRKVATVGDIDIAVSAKNTLSAIDYFTKIPQVARVLEKGKHKASVVLKSGQRVDLMVTTPDRFGSLLQHFTGSKMHNIHLRKIANEKGLSLSEYGISKIHDKGEQFAQDLLAKCKTEEEFYQMLGMDYIQPELREDTGEIEAAIRSAKARPNGLPKLVELDNIKGDLHIHSNFKIETSHDLGVNSIAELAKKAENLGYEYIAITDHNPSVSRHSESQIEKLFGKRQKLIEQINSSRGIKLLSGSEVDIMADGQLALPDKILEQLDWIVASVHSSFNQNVETMTKRVLSAIKNPNVNVIGHPTGRLIGSREGYEVAWEAIFEGCKKYNCALEINSWPERLDLPDVIVREAVAAGVKLIISTDSHAVEHLDNMKFGVAVAKRGWAEKENILNTLSWFDFAKFFKLK